MKEYKIIGWRFFERNTENELNVLAMDGWEIFYVCREQPIILVRERKK